MGMAFIGRQQMAQSQHEVDTEMSQGGTNYKQASVWSEREREERGGALQGECFRSCLLFIDASIDENKTRESEKNRERDAKR